MILAHKYYEMQLLVILGKLVQGSHDFHSKYVILSQNYNIYQKTVI